MSAEALVTLAFGIVVGAAIMVSAMVHGYVGAVIKHGKRRDDDR